MGGISKTRNECLRRATGEYLFILDDDDWLEPTCIEKEMARLQEGFDRVFCDYTLVNEQGAVTGWIAWKVQTIQELLGGNLMPHGSTLMRREMMNGIWYDETIESAVDYDLNFQLLLKHPDMRIGKVNERLENYRVHEKREGKYKRQIDSANKVREKYRELISIGT